MSAARTLGPRVAVLKEGSEKALGPEHIASNAKACRTIADILKSTLGPAGQDIFIARERQPFVSNDGATILDALIIKHPAAKILVDISKSQDKIVGDGTSSVVILASEMLVKLSELLNSSNSSHSVVSVLSQCAEYCEKVAREQAIDISDNMDEFMLKCATTALSSKILSGNANLFAELALKAIKTIGIGSSLNLVGIKTLRGGSVSESQIVEGFALPKCFAYAGAKSQPYSFSNPKIALLEIELEHKAERSNAEVRINTVEEYQNVVDAEWKILFDKLEKIANSGANVVFSSLPIGDVAYQFFSDRNIYCGGRVAKEDLIRASKSCGGRLQTSLDNLGANLGTCGEFNELQIGAERYVVCQGALKAKSCTIIIRGAGEFTIDESKRSLHDALKVVQKISSCPHVVVGGGAIEMALSTKLRQFALEKFKGKKIVFAQKIADAFEVIPNVLASNCSFNSTEIISKLRKLHSEGKHTYGVNSFSTDDGFADNAAANVYEPLDLILNKLYTVFESCKMLLQVNQTIKAPRLQAISQDLVNAKRAIEDNEELP